MNYKKRTIDIAITLMTYLAKRVEFLCFQNWKNNTTYNVTLVKNIGSTSNCNDLKKPSHT